MKKIASFVSLTLAAVGLASGCAVDVQDEALDVGAGDEAVCNNVDGTNAMLASLASVMAVEFGRWQITQDLVVGVGTNNQQILKIKDKSKCLDGGKCARTQWILDWQNSQYDQQYVFKGGQKLNSWTFASRLVAGFGNQLTCDNRGFGDANGCRIGEKIGNTWYGVSHFLNKTSAVPTTCDGVDQGLELWTYSAVRGKSDGTIGNPGGTPAPLPAGGANELRKKLIWATNGATSPNMTSPNPYLVFSSPDNMTVVIDPGGDNGEQPPPPAQVCDDKCQGTAPVPAPDGVNLPFGCCTCNGVGGLFKPATGRVPPGTWKCMPS